MKLHLLPPSPGSRKLLFLNAHLGLDLPVSETFPSTGANRTEGYLALNPNGKMPVLEFDDGGSLWESNAILNHLAAGTALLPEGRALAQVQQWQFWETAHWLPALRPFLLRHFFQQGDIDLDQPTTECRTLAAILDGHLTGRDWLVGDGLTTADIAVAAVLVYRSACHFPLDGFDALAAWMARLEAFPAWAKANPPMG